MVFGTKVRQISTTEPRGTPATQLRQKDQDAPGEHNCGNRDCEKPYTAAGEVLSSRLRALTDLAEDTDSGPHAILETHNCLKLQFHTLFCPPYALQACACPQRPPHTHTNK